MLAGASETIRWMRCGSVTSRPMSSVISMVLGPNSPPRHPERSPATRIATRKQAASTGLVFMCCPRSSFDTVLLPGGQGGPSQTQSPCFTAGAGFRRKRPCRSAPRAPVREGAPRIAPRVGLLAPDHRGRLPSRPGWGSGSMPGALSGYSGGTAQALHLIPSWPPKGDPRGYSVSTSVSV